MRGLASIRPRQGPKRSSRVLLSHLSLCDSLNASDRMLSYLLAKIPAQTPNDAPSGVRSPRESAPSRLSIQGRLQGYWPGLRRNEMKSSRWYVEDPDVAVVLLVSPRTDVSVLSPSATDLADASITSHWIRPHGGRLAIEWAAGGIVLEHGGVSSDPDSRRILLIKRNGLWDLPKGKLEADDASMSACSIREVSEETGVEATLDPQGSSVAALTTQHVYERSNTLRIKTTLWYTLHYVSGSLKAQVEEGIEDMAWCALPDALERISFPSLTDLLQRWTVASR